MSQFHMEKCWTAVMLKASATFAAQNFIMIADDNYHGGDTEVVGFDIISTWN